MGNDKLLTFILEKYIQLNSILDDFEKACSMENSLEKDSLVASIKQRTNHLGVHYTPLELVTIFLGSSVL